MPATQGSFWEARFLPSSVPFWGEKLPPTSAPAPSFTKRGSHIAHSRRHDDPTFMPSGFINLSDGPTAQPGSFFQPLIFSSRLLPTGPNKMETTALFLTIPIINLVGVTLNAAFPLYRLVRELSTVEDKVMKQMEEIHVMLLVFDECEKLLENKRFNMQRSLGAVLLTCDNRRRDLLKTERQYRALNAMQKSRQTYHPLLHRFFLRWWFQHRLIMHERRQRNFYAAFRESTLLLQEMCSG